MAIEFIHCHYTGFPTDRFDTLAIFKVMRDGKLVAVVREPEDFALINEPIPGMNYRVDCVAADDELRAAVAAYFLGKSVVYFESGPKWFWRDNGTYEEMPWRVAPKG